MPRSRSWWWVVLFALPALFLKAALLGPSVASTVEGATTEALEREGLDEVRFVSVDGVNGIAGSGMRVTVQGPAVDRSLAIATVLATEEVGHVTYRSVGRGDE